jgi:intein/homing endonuclease
MIEITGGRAKSQRTREELEAMLKREMSSLTPDEKEALEIIIQELSKPQQGPTLLDTLTKVEYKRTPVSMEQFVKDPYYLGNTCENIYPVLMKDLEDLFSGGYHEAVWTGCIDLDSLVQGANGSLRTIRDWIGTTGEVIGFSPEGSKAAKTGIAKHSGIQPTMRLTLANGMAQRLTPNHQVMAWRDGYAWVRTEDLEPGDFLVVPRQLNTTPDSNLSVNEAKLLAYWTTDGSSSEQRSRFTDGNSATTEEVVALLESLGYAGTRTQISPKCWEVYVNEHKRSGFLEWLRTHEGHYKTKEVLVPDSVCRAKLPVVAAFLNRVWAAEGCVYIHEEVSPPRFTLGMTSERYIRQVQLLLLRFGVMSRVVFTPQYDKRSGKTTETWLLTVSGVGPLKKFLQVTGPILGKESKCAQVAAYCESRSENTNVDVLPIERKWLSRQMTLGGIQRPAGSTWWCLAQGTGKHLSRQMFDKWLAEYGNTALGAQLRRQFPAEFAFERIVTLEDAGETEVGDICDVEGITSFVSNGIYAHNSIGYGKTHVATIGVCRVLYELSCMTNPHKSYGLANGSNLSIVCMSVNETLAVKVVFEAIASKIKDSPYFEEHFPFEDTKKEMRFPGGIWIAARASTDTSALGLNAIGALMDEQNFLARTAKEAQMGIVDRAETIYNTIQRRMKSRFERHGKLPGMLFIVSSKKTMDDFTARRIRDSKDDPTVFVRDYALWDTKPEDQYSKERFWVLCGNDTVPSKVLTDAEYAKFKDNVPENATLIAAPEDFRKDFERDLEGCLTGDTKIPLLDGSEIPIAELVGREEFWTYSYGPDGRFYPGRGHSARLTRSDAPIVEVLLDNGERIRCTPNHRFMLRDGTYAEARELHPGTSLMPCYRRRDRHGYELLKSNVGGKWVHTHRLVALESQGVPLKTSTVVHHRNFREGDNTPSNLQEMTVEDHTALHAARVHLTIHSPEARTKAAATRSRLAAIPGPFRDNLLTQLRKARALYAGSAANKAQGQKSGLTYGFGRAVRTDAQKRVQSLNGTKNITKLNFEDNPSKRSHNRQASRTRLKQMSVADRKNATMRGLHARWHKGPYEVCSICSGVQTPAYRLQKQLGSTSVAGSYGCHIRWKHEGEFEVCHRCRSDYNHKVVSVTPAGHADVYDITVDTQHNFALTGGVVVHNSIRDLAGVATVAINPFIQRREKLQECVDHTRTHPFSALVYDPSKPGNFIWSKMVKESSERGFTGSPHESSLMLRPILNPRTPRHIHIDPSLRGDATGFVMAHIGGWTDVVRRSDDKKEYLERAPIYIVDLMLRIVPPTGGEIVLGELRHLVYDLSAHGYMITGVTLDSWQSADTIQQLNQRGFQSKVLSVDVTTDPYENLKTALYENRVSYYEYTPVIEELQQLERKFDGRRTKIDHPPKGKKDVADALAAALFALSTTGVAQPLPFMKSVSYTGDAWMEEQQQSALAGHKASVANTDLPAFFRGDGSDKGNGGGWGSGGGGWGSGDGGWG